MLISTAESASQGNLACGGKSGCKKADAKAGSPTSWLEIRSPWWVAGEHTLRALLAVSQTRQTHTCLTGGFSLSVPSPGTLFPTCLHGSPYSLYSDGGLNTSSLQRPPRPLTQSRGSPISPCPLLCLQASFAVTPCPCLVYSGLTFFHNCIYFCGCPGSLLLCTGSL